MYKLSFLVLWVLLVSTSPTLFAQANLSVQGTIQRSFGAAVDDGNYSLTFRLYETDAGGTPIWEETQDAVEVIGGVYSVVLGATEPLDAPFDKPYFLGVSVDGGTELTPRATLTSSPYALSLVGQDNTFPSTGPVGVGTNEPEGQQALHVVGNTKLEGDMQVTSNVQIQGNLEITGTVTGIDMDVDFTNIDSDINTTGNLNAAGDITANDGKPVPVATEESVPLRIMRGQFGENGTPTVGTGFTVQRTGAGVYVVTFDTPFSDPPTITATGTLYNGVVRIQEDASGEEFTVTCHVPTCCNRDSGISFIAIGPR